MAERKFADRPEAGQGSRVEPNGPAEEQARLQEELASTDKLIQSARTELAVYQEILADLELDRDRISAELAILKGAGADDSPGAQDLAGSRAA